MPPAKQLVIDHSKACDQSGRCVYHTLDYGQLKEITAKAKRPPTLRSAAPDSQSAAASSQLQQLQVQ